MRLEADSAFLEIERSEVGAPDDPVDHDLLLNVTVKVANYSAADQCWIAANDLDKFLLALRSLERQRQGKAVLVGADPQDLRLVFSSTNSSGHTAVHGYVGWQKSEEFPLQLKFGFEFEPDRLPSVLEYFEMISRR
jgi:hypothetical protein